MNMNRFMYMSFMVTVSLSMKLHWKYLPLSQRDVKITDEFIKVYALDIVQKWIDYFILKKSVQCTRIKTRI